MGTLGTFDSFTTARLGIYAAQHGLRVTGNNISNINTAGYTRQRVDQVSFKTGGHDRYASMLDRHVGNGALVSGISQIRDPYLDIRYRNTSSATSYHDTRLSGLEEIASILDEVAKGGSSADGTEGDGLLYAQLQELAKQLRAYGANPTKDNDTLVRGAADALTMMFRNKADLLERLRQDKEAELDKEVEAVNGILTNIRDLNKSIRDAEIHGDKALELRDERNRQIDELSTYMHIKVEYSMEDVGAGIQVEKLTISLGNSNPDPKVETDSSVLVDGLYATQLSIPEEKPVLNQFFGSNDPHYADIKDYLYVKEYHVVDIADAPAGSVLQLDEKGVPVKDKDGNLICLVGTNVVDEATQVDNGNYTVQLGKLLDEKGEEWKSSKTTWTEVGSAGAKAVYQYGITSSGTWAAGNTLKIDDAAGNPVTYIVGTAPGFTEDVANDSAKLAAFIADKLTPPAGFDITVNGSNIIYTAQNVGAVAAADEPTLTLDNPGKVTLGNRENPVVGKDADNVDQSNAGTVTDPVTGNTVTTAYTEVDGKWYRVTMETKHTREVALDDNDLYGSIQALREMLTEEGEFSCQDDITIDENAMIKRGLPYYQKSLDLLAQQIAKRYNELNQGFLVNQDGNYIDKDGKELMLDGADGSGPFPVSKYDGLNEQQALNLINNGYFLKDENGNPILDKDGNQQADVNAWLKDKGGVPHEYSGPLFSNSNSGDDVTGITASNIDISHSWSSGAVRIVPKFEVLFDDGTGDKVENSTQNINVNHMISMIDKPLLYDPKDIDPDAMGDDLFTGSFNDMVNNMMGVQAKDASITNVALNTSYTTLVSLDTSREGVSGVDLNDEAMNMMQYQKAYSAACRLMTAIDEALDRLINNTGIAGR